MDPWHRGSFVVYGEKEPLICLMPPPKKDRRLAWLSSDGA